MTMLFNVFFVVDFVLIFGVMFSVRFPKRRVWPPPQKGSWQFWASWIVATLGMLGTPILGALDFNSLGGWNWIYLLTGGLFITLGTIIVIWAITTLSEHQSLGLKGKIITGGPYQHSRNPQYLGFIILYSGIILTTFSFMALVTGTIIIAMFVLLPFSEEPWLLQEYGKAYENYCTKVPRFLSVNSLKRKQPQKGTKPKK
jgi:protein-S-isoprenylcysteine O-methyltransferase Ste14